MSEQSFNPTDLAASSDTFCILPWMHQYIGTRGDIKPCCAFEHTLEIGNLKKETLADTWNNDKTKNVRLELLNGKIPKGCEICDRKGKGMALADAANSWFYDTNAESGVKFDIMQQLASTQSDGTVADHKLFYMDTRFNNLCNLSCRTCGPHFSTTWAAERKKIAILTNMPLRDDGIDTGLQFAGKTVNDAYEQLLPHFPNLTRIYFAGGEPMMQVEHYNTLKELIRTGRTDVELWYNANFSRLTLGKDDAIELWKNFKSVRMMASLDGSYLKGEYWRNGLHWSDAIRHREKMLAEAPHVEFYVSFVVSWPNIFNLLEFHKEWFELGYISSVEHFSLNLLEGPAMYSLQNLPEWKKIKIKAAITNHIVWINSNSLNGNSTIAFALNRFVESMMQPAVDLQKSLTKFAIETKMLDNVRDQNFWEVYPEHLDLKEYMQQEFNIVWENL